MARTIQAHDTAVLAVGKISLPASESEILLTVGADGSIAGWSLSNGDNVLPHLTLGTPLLAAAVLPSGQVLAAASDGRLLSWQPGDEEAQRAGSHKNARLLQPFAAESKILVVDDARGVGLWPAGGGRLKRIAKKEAAAVAAAAAAMPVAPPPAVAVEPGDVHVADLASLPALEENRSLFFAVAAAGRRVIGVDASGTVQMWDLDTGRLLGVISAASGRDDHLRSTLIPTFAPPVLSSPAGGGSANLGLTTDFKPGGASGKRRAPKNPLAGLEEMSE